MIRDSNSAVSDQLQNIIGIRSGRDGNLHFAPVKMVSSRQHGLAGHDLNIPPSSSSSLSGPKFDVQQHHEFVRREEEMPPVVRFTSHQEDDADSGLKNIQFNQPAHCKYLPLRTF